jgi:hypothetical protein
MVAGHRGQTLPADIWDQNAGFTEQRAMAPVALGILGNLLSGTRPAANDAGQYMKCGS